MKKLILAAFALTTAASVFAQGTITFNNFVSGDKSRVYAPLASNPDFSQIGFGTSDTPAGTFTWAQQGFTLIGVTLTGQYGASATMVELLAATGLNDPASSLSPATSGGITTFHTGSAGGGIVVAPATTSFADLPDDYNGGVTVEMVAWDDSSGLYSTWALASVAWENGLIAAGVSGTENLTATIGGTSDVGPNLQGVASFNLYFIPEPGTFALAGLGMAAMLVFRRRK